MQAIERKKTEEILIDAGLLSIEKLREIKEMESITGEKIEKILLSEGVINYKEALSTLAKKMGVEFVDLENAHINKSAISIIKPQIAAKYNVLPFDIRNNLLFLAMQNPDDIFLIDEIKVFTQMEIKPFLADSRFLGRAIKYFYESGNTEIKDIKEDIQKTVVQEAKDREGEGKGQYDCMDKSCSKVIAGVDELIRNIIEKAMKMDCRDIHIDSFNRNPRVRYRMDGRLVEEKFKNDIGYEDLVAKVKAMASLPCHEGNIHEKGSIVYDMNHKEKVAIEVNILPVVGGENLLMRLEGTRGYFSLEDIGMSEKEQKSVKEMIKKKSGMVIVTGLNFSGKTTTCYGLIKEIVSKELNIITIEKKVLQKIEGISQILLEEKGENTFKELIDSIIVHNPDVIFADVDMDITSVENRSVMKMLMSMALSGKLVIVTMNIPSVFETISGLINTGFEKYMVAVSIEGIIAQNLLRKRCKVCENKSDSERPYDIAEDRQDKLEEKCAVCGGIGFKGKTGVFEVFAMNKDYKRLIIQEKNLEQLESKIDSEHSSFRNNCIRLLNDNVTTVEEIIRVGIGKDILNF